VKRIQRLRAELASDLRAFDSRLDELARLGTLAEPGPAAVAAVALHHAYGAVESALLRVARELGEGAPTGPDWHQALLDTMALDIPDVRPAVLSADTRDSLARLLAFRHFFRHAYAVALDAERLDAVRSSALGLREPMHADLAHFDVFLVDLAREDIPGA
jgi:hypothetical protein